MRSWFYRVLGLLVWKSARFYLSRLPLGKRLAAGGIAALVVGAVVAAATGAKRTGSDLTP